MLIFIKDYQHSSMPCRTVIDDENVTLVISSEIDQKYYIRISRKDLEQN